MTLELDEFNEILRNLMKAGVKISEKLMPPNTSTHGKEFSQLSARIVFSFSLYLMVVCFLLSWIVILVWKSADRKKLGHILEVCKNRNTVYFT